MDIFIQSNLKYKFLSNNYPQMKVLNLVLCHDENYIQRENVNKPNEANANFFLMQKIQTQLLVRIIQRYFH